MKKYTILIPLFNDWQSISRLLNEIDLQTSKWDAEVSVLIVNDASTEKRTELVCSYKKLKSVKILNMKKNRVHQRCIAAGLKYICLNEDFDWVIVMDADGEDRPEELNVFFKKTQENPNATITGDRVKRSEGIIFKILYELHKFLTLIFTGKSIKFGNFTCLPKKHVKQLIQTPYLWNSYSSSVARVVEHRVSIPSIRGIRYVLPSKMNLLGLIFHSFAIISVFIKLVFYRSVAFFLIYFFLIFKNISILNFIPILLLFLFVLTIYKISQRSNMEEFDKCLDNIDSIDILTGTNERQ